MENKKIAKVKKNPENFKQCRNWCFTDFQMLNFDTLYHTFKDTIRYLCVGQEICPSTKKVHQQGWIQLVNKKTLGGLRRLIGSRCIHLEPCRGDEYSNDTYCKKDNNFKQWGHFIIQGQRSDLEEIKQKLDEGASLKNIADDYFSDFIRYHSGLSKYKGLVEKEKTKTFRKLTVIVHEGPTGTGKTRTAMEQATYKIEGSHLNWWDGYDGDTTILIDEFANQIPITEMLNILDGYQLRLPIKGGFTYANWSTVFITTNLSFEEWYPNAHPEHKKALRRRINQWFHMDTAKVTKGNTTTLVTNNCNLSITSDFMLED